MHVFWADPQNNREVSVDDLLVDLNNKSEISLRIKSGDAYSVLLELLSGFIYNVKTELLDSDFSLTEIQNMGIDSNGLTDKFIIDEKKSISDFEELLNLIDENSEKAAVTLYTSGTTGRPKKVTHSLKTLMRNARKTDKHRGDVWAFAYSPTHIAGLQVFLQALLNQNTMINVFRLSSSEIRDALHKYSVTHISATPTFIRKLFAGGSGEFPLVKRVTFGGERYDASLNSEISRVFPNARVLNLYASTEAGGLFSSRGDEFEIPEEQRDLIKFNELNELLIQNQLLGSFDSLQVDENGYYNTGDIVEFSGRNTFRFVSRKSDFVNVGGFKVNPNEVEMEIMKVNGVKDVLVKGRKNSVTGSVLVADVVKFEDKQPAELELEIINELKNNLQQFKIPRIIRFVDSLSLTRTGKKERI